MSVLTGSAVDASLRTARRLPATVYAGVFLFLVLKPLYLWDSGYPQIADGVLVLTVVRTLVWSGGGMSYTREEKPIVVLSALFAYYATLVNLLALVVVSGESEFMRSSLFLLYNAFVLMWFVYILHRDSQGVARAAVAGIVVGLVIEFGLVMAGGGFGAERALGTFNNPNQLGYYAVLCAAVLVTAIRTSSTRSSITVVGLVLCLLLAVASLSKAAIGALAILVVGIVLVGVPGGGGLSRRVRAAVVAGIGLAVLAYHQVADLRHSVLVTSVVQRFTSGESDNDLGSRGYLRLLEHPEHWVFGAGEGQAERWGATHEFHSLLGNVQLSYGIVGLLLFLGVIAVAVRRSGLTGVYVMGAVMAYGLTHNGIRNTILWILIGLLAFAVPASRSARGTAAEESAEDAADAPGPPAQTRSRLR